MTKTVGMALGADGEVARVTDELLLPIGAPMPQGLSQPTLQPYLGLLIGDEVGDAVFEAGSSIWMVHGVVVVRDGDEIRGMWTAPRGRIADELDLRFTGVLVHANGEVINSGTGAAGHGHPAGALLAVQDALHEDEDVATDMVLAPGLTPPIPVTPGLAYGFEFNDGLGEIHIAG
ncbi:hypothetical protein [Enemella sp. A6]|uniref:hypothetical protein n=1 Tax=Enemella sp. A6 TaxID=3440152 RepID=UPI003EBAACF5